jgi:hypothetical protein
LSRHEVRLGLGELTFVKRLLDCCQAGLLMGVTQFLYGNAQRIREQCFVINASAKAVLKTSRPKLALERR